MKEFSNTKAGRTALGGVLAAGSLAMLWLASVSPTAQLGLTAVAGLFPVGAVLAAGRSGGYLCWVASSVLSMLVVPDKGVSLLYLGFFGLYPVLKSQIESLRNLWIEWPVKLAFFTGVFCVFWFGLRGILVPMLPDWLTSKTFFLYLMGIFVFLCYDIGLSRLIGGLMARLRPKPKGRM